jgi:hypothetical protein
MKTNVQLKSNLTIKKLFTVLSIGAFSMMFSQGTSAEKPIKIGEGNPQVLKAEVKRLKKQKKFRLTHWFLCFLQWKSQCIKTETKLSKMQ